MALVHRVRVEDPCHLAGARPHVRRRNVPLRPDLHDDLGRIAARHALELALGHALGIADDATLGAPEGNAHQGALPGHPHRERLHLVERDVRVVADATFRRAAGDVVRDAMALEGGNRAVVHAGRDGHGHGFLDLREHADEIRIDVKRLPDELQLLLSELEGVLAEVGGWDVNGGHGCSLLGCDGRRLFHCEADGAPSGLAAGRRPRDEPELVPACAQARTIGSSAGEAECVLPR